MVFAHSVRSKFLIEVTERKKFEAVDRNFLSILPSCDHFLIVEHLTGNRESETFLESIEDTAPQRRNTHFLCRFDGHSWRK